MNGPHATSALSPDNKDVSVMMSEMDVNAIAGTLKLYFRELPEPLFTDEFYPNFAEGIGEFGTSHPTPVRCCPWEGQGQGEGTQVSTQTLPVAEDRAKSKLVLEGLRRLPTVPVPPCNPGGEAASAAGNMAG